MLSPELSLLSKIRRHAIQNLQRQPNYTCVETVERTRRSARTKKFQLMDTLRLEVGLVNGKEMFAWPGEKKFEYVDLIKMVPEGAIGNGSFALHERAIFEGQGATFQYRGEEPLGGRPSVRFDYKVPLLMSGYTLRVSNRQAVVGYHGSVYADPKSFDVQRLEVAADNIPVQLGLAEAADRVEYARITIGEGEFLLPETSELTMTFLDRGESRNRIRFSSCREFTGESVLTFDEAPRTTAAAAPAAQIELPPETVIELSLLDDVNVRDAAVGDPVRARLLSDLKHNGRVLFSKGATATGRISRLEKSEEYIAVGIEFTEMESGQAQGRLNLRLDDIAGGQLFRASPRRTRPPEPRPGEGIILLRPDRFMLMHGTIMSWRTIS